MLQQFLPIVKTARLEARQQLCAHYETDRNDFLYSNVTANKSWVHHYDQGKASHLNTITPLLPERIHSRLSLLGIQKHHLQLKVRKSTVRHMWDLKQVETIKQFFGGERKWCFFNIITPNPTVWSHFSGDTQHQIWRCFTPLMQPKFGTVWLLVVCSYQETSQRNTFHMWWRRSSC